jgi:hypothetical protein
MFFLGNNFVLLLFSFIFVKELCGHWVSLYKTALTGSATSDRDALLQGERYRKC